MMLQDTEFNKGKYCLWFLLKAKQNPCPWGNNGIFVTSQHVNLQLKGEKKLKAKMGGDKSYLYLPSSEKRLIQSHGSPDRFFVCELNIGKPGKQQPKTFLQLFIYLLISLKQAQPDPTFCTGLSRNSFHFIYAKCSRLNDPLVHSFLEWFEYEWWCITPWDAPCICHKGWWLCLLNRSHENEPPALLPWHRSPPEERRKITYWGVQF